MSRKELQKARDAKLPPAKPPISDLPILTEAQRHQLLVEWNDTATEYPRDKCVHQLFEAQVEQTPDAVALIFGHKQLTYRELNSRANQLAHYLMALGVRPEVKVGICVARSIEMVVGLLGIIKAGGAYVPLDPTYPKERLAFMLSDAEAALLLSQKQFTLPEYSGQLLELERHVDRVAKENRENPAIQVTPDNLLYVLYTSGSTGKPKGVLGLHRGAVNRMSWMQQRYPFQTGEIGCQKSSLSFVDAVAEIFAPLLAGIPLVLIPDEVVRDPSRLITTLATHRITRLVLVPSLLRAILDTPVELSSLLKELKIWVSSGEALPRELVERFHERLPAHTLLNLYGSSEVSADVTWYETSPNQSLSTVPIGRPIANTQLYILDQSHNPVPIGVPGRLYVGGVGLARGYMRAELDTGCFMRNPFAAGRLYETGDLARYLPDGNLEFLARVDDQVKIRGVRIELGEIELILGQHSAVRECVVLAQENKDGMRRLVAYVVPAQTASLTVGVLRSFLSEKLPDSMIPATFVNLERLPLTPNGKIDRRALPAPDEGRPQLANAYVAPQSVLERLLADKWQAVLGIEKIGIHDDFFKLGGDSIRGAILINQLQQALGEVIYVVALFDAPTIASLANYLQQHYAKAVARVGGITLEHDTSLAKPKIDAQKIAHFRQLIPPLPALDRASTHPKNPPAIFILSSPRSGSTLFRVMLGGHSKLFAPPELDLLSFDTLAERQQALSGRFSFRLEGLWRAIMQLQGCQPEEAIQLMQEYQRKQLTTAKFYGILQEWIGEERILVDKTPAYALDIETLKRAEIDFDKALYIHLLRHPAGMIHSFEQARTAQVFFRHEHPFSARELAELTWLVSHQNILDFLTTVPPSRQYGLKFEELVAQPRRVMQQISHFLRLSFEEPMWQPYQKQERRMTDGIYAVSKMLGDVKFQSHRQIDARVANRWPQEMADSLSELTSQLAQRLGYRKPAPQSNTVPTIKRAERSSYRMKRSASGRLIGAKKEK